MREGESKGKSLILRLLTHSPDSHNNWGWARLKLRGRSLIQVLDVGAGTHILRAFPTAFPKLYAGN